MGSIRDTRDKVTQPYDITKISAKHDVTIKLSSSIRAEAQYFFSTPFYESQQNMMSQ